MPKFRLVVRISCRVREELAQRSVAFGVLEFRKEFSRGISPLETPFVNQGRDRRSGEPLACRGYVDFGITRHIAESLDVKRLTFGISNPKACARVKAADDPLRGNMVEGRPICCEGCRRKRQDEGKAGNESQGNIVHAR